VAILQDNLQDPRVIVVLTFMLELVLTLSWWRPLFHTGLPVLRRELALPPATGLDPEALFGPLQDEGGYLAFKAHEDEILIRCRFVLSWTPLLRGRVSRAEGRPMLRVFVQWWVLVLFGLVVWARSPLSFRDDTFMLAVVGASLALLVGLELRGYRRITDFLKSRSLVA